jgi:hypothetical protein
LPAGLFPARLPRQAGKPAEKDFREYEEEWVFSSKKAATVECFIVCITVNWQPESFFPFLFLGDTRTFRRLGRKLHFPRDQLRTLSPALWFSAEFLLL